VREGTLDATGTVVGTDQGASTSEIHEEGSDEEIFEDRTFFHEEWDIWGRHAVPEDRWGTILRSRAPSDRRSDEVHRSRIRRTTKEHRDSTDRSALDEESEEHGEMHEVGSRDGAATTTTRRSERVSVHELETVLGTHLINPPIGRGLHIEMGEPATFVDHALDPLPLDAPGADLRVEQLVRAQRERLDAAWERRRPAAACVPPPEPPGPPMPDASPLHEPAPHAQRARRNRGHRASGQSAPTAGPAPTWAPTRGARG
jgi:hypothetical protein